MIKSLLFITLFVSLLYGRKLFSYIGYQNIYIIELSFALMLTWSLYKIRLSDFKNTSRIHNLLIILSSSVFLLGIFKFFNCHTAECLREMPILIYPVYYVIGVLFLSKLNSRYISLIMRCMYYGILIFPFYYLFIYGFDIIKLLADSGLSLWPNNNPILIAALSPFMNGISSLYSIFQICFIMFPAYVGLLVEAQRGAILIFIIVALLLFLKRPRSILPSVIVAFLWVLSASLIGGNFSSRFNGGHNDVKNFIEASNPKILIESISTNDNQKLLIKDDIRYSSTSDRINMWKEVIGTVSNSYNYLLIGLPLDIKLVNRPWRNPHNGYISSFGRGGIIGLLCYLSFAAFSLTAFFSKKGDKYFNLINIFFIALCIDAITQTTFDSPYSLALFFITAAIIQIYVCNQDKSVV